MNLSEVGVSYYEIGGEIQTSTVSSTTSVTNLSGVEASNDPNTVVAADVRGVCYAPAQQQSEHLPYTGIGHPLTNIGFNALLRGFKAAGFYKDPHPTEAY